jgi:hypothetical protein
MTQPVRCRACRKNGIDDIEVRGLANVRHAIDSGAGVLLTPNHPFHYDTYTVVHASDQVGTAFYYMAAWQVFARVSRWAQWSLQNYGCFSVNREGNDTQAFRTAIDILQRRAHPLAIFAEGEVYHTNDRVTPFRDGAAMIGLMAARKSERPIVCIPVAIKYWLIDEPLAELEATLQSLEGRVYWRARPERTLVDRLYQLAAALLAIKEIEYLGEPKSGSVNQRLTHLLQHILLAHEAPLSITGDGKPVPERIKEIRRRAIERLESATDPPTDPMPWARALEDMFLATQLYSYPGNYVAEHPTIERLAETIDKLEEDMLGVPFPSIRGRRRVIVSFDEPIELPREKGGRDQVAEYSTRFESRVQAMIDQLNAEFPRAPMGGRSL